MNLEAVIDKILLEIRSFTLELEKDTQNIEFETEQMKKDTQNIEFETEQMKKDIQNSEFEYAKLKKENVKLEAELNKKLFELNIRSWEQKMDIQDIEFGIEESEDEFYNYVTNNKLMKHFG